MLSCVPIAEWYVEQGVEGVRKTVPRRYLIRSHTDRSSLEETTRESLALKGTVGRPEILPSKSLILAAFLNGMIGLAAQAQSVPSQVTPSPTPAPVASSTQQGVTDRLPDAPGQAAADPQSSGSIHGTVTDPSGDLLEGVRVTLDNDTAKTQQTLLTDSMGFFNFTGVAPGTFRVTVTSKGFDEWTAPEIVLQPGETSNCRTLCFV